MRRAWGCPPAAPVAGRVFPHFPIRPPVLSLLRTVDRAKPHVYPPDAPLKGGSGEQGEVLVYSARRRLVVYAAQQRDAEVLPGKTQGFCQHFLALPRDLRLAG